PRRPPLLPAARHRGRSATRSLDSRPEVAPRYLVRQADRPRPRARRRPAASAEPRHPRRAPCRGALHASRRRACVGGSCRVLPGSSGGGAGSAGDGVSRLSQGYREHLMAAETASVVPETVLAQLVSAIPSELRPHIVIIGSLAAAYWL